MRENTVLAMRLSLFSMSGALATALLLQVASKSPNDKRLSWVPNPRVASGGWVADPAHHLSGATVRSINAIVDSLEREKTIELAVVVVDSLNGLEPADAALLLHRRWGVGKRQRDNGIVFLWSPALRKLYVSIGYGLEGVLPDARTGRILDQAVLPSFRGGNFDEGILQGVRALASAAREETVWRPDSIAPGRPTSAAVQAPRTEPVGGSPRSPTALFVGLGGLFVVIAGSISARPLWRRRPRRCPSGHGAMRRLSEEEDDAMLSRAEGLEERLGSVDYDVWVCSQCTNRLVIPYRKWFSAYKECPRCKRFTCETRTVTLRAATTLSTGMQSITRECENCGFKDTRREIIPQIVVTTSSGSDSGGGSSFGGSSFGGGGGGGGGSSFGGGSAGGGGAGRSY